MPRYRIRMINSQFESCDDADYPSLEAIREAAISTAAKVASESIENGEHTAAIELEIYEDTILVARHVVTLSVADLMAAER